MLTTSETILFVTVWSLTGIGLFFGTRATLRKRRLAKQSKGHESNPEESNTQDPTSEESENNTV